mgnify:CR=1 FL=1
MRSLIEAVHNGDTAAIQDYLAAGASPNTVDEKTGESILAIATWKNDLAVVELLLDLGADPNFVGTTAWPLENAAGQGNTEIVELLLQHDAEMEVQDEDGGTPLIDAAAGGHPEIVDLLLDAGADPRHRDRYGKRAILFAAEKGHSVIVERLAPLSTAKDRRAADLMLKLATQGPPTDDVQRFFDAAETGDVKSVTAYLDAGGNVDAMDEDGETALFGAAHRGQLDVTRLLVENGADVNHLNAYGGCALGRAGTRHKSAAYDFLYERTSKKLRDELDKRLERGKRIAAEYGFTDFIEQTEEDTKEKS